MLQGKPTDVRRRTAEVHVRDRTRRRTAGALALALLAPAAGSQGAGDEAARRPPDPYTGGEPKVLAAAGYVSQAPFLYFGELTTEDVEEILGNVPLLWLETAHFRIGSTLPEFALSSTDSRVRDKIRKELTHLAKRLPKVDTSPRVLDPWLRVHLAAQRLEGIHGEFQRLLGVTDADFPAGAGDHGKGPYLGMPDKLTVMLTQRESTLARFVEHVSGRRVRHPTRHHDAASGTLFFGNACEFAGGTMFDDTAMHCALVYNTVANMVDAYRYYGVEVPAWFRSGLAQWYLRRVDPRHNNFRRAADGGEDPDARGTGWDWQPRVRALVLRDRVRPASEMFALADISQWRFTDYMVAWSRVDYLLSLGEARMRRFLHGMKEPVDKGQRIPTAEEMRARQDALMLEIWGVTPQTFDERWRTWVRETYRRRPIRLPPIAEVFLPRD